MYLALLFQKIFNLKYLLLRIRKHWTRREIVRGIVIIATLTLIIQVPYRKIEGISRQVICSLVGTKNQLLQRRDQRNSAAIINRLGILNLIIFKVFPKITKIQSSNSNILHSLIKEVATYKGLVYSQVKIRYQISLRWKIILKRLAYRILNWTNITMEMQKVKRL